MNSFSLRKILLIVGGFFLLLLSLYIGLTWSTPYFRREEKTISVIKPFHFYNQYGELVDERIWDGRVGLAYFFFTSCQNVCPLIYSSIATIQQEFSGNEKFIVLGHTCDPDTDSVGKLLQYANQMGIPPKGWALLTGSNKDLYEAARFMYKIDDPKQEIDSTFHFMHTQHVAIVADHKIVYIFDALKADDIEEAKKKIENLLNN